jgi:hypothetical protein
MGFGALEVVVVRVVGAPTAEAPVSVRPDPALWGREVMSDLMASGALDQRQTVTCSYEFNLATKHANPL